MVHSAPTLAPERIALTFDSNILFYGDNLEFLADPDVFPSESVDLIYLDPPFNSNASYNVLFKEVSGEPSAAQIKAFDDTWSWDQAANAVLYTLMGDPHTPSELAALIKTFHQFLGHSPMLAYLVQMAVRLTHMRRVLKPTGSLYLHCDPTASHYLKLVLDAVFGARQFRTEIIWKRSTAHSDTKQGRKQHGRIHDSIFYYTKSSRWTWNPIYTPYDDEYVRRFYRYTDSSTRRKFRVDNLTAAKPGGDTEYEWRVKRKTPSSREWVADLTDEYQNPRPGWEYKGVPPYKGRFWAYSKDNMKEFAKQGRIYHSRSGVPCYKRYLDEMPGVALQDIWVDIPPTRGTDDLGYPTQKPVELLKRIVAASSNPGDVVLDPFCGCGTTIDAVETLNRAHPDQPPRIWLGIDITHLAVNLIKHRLARFDPPPVYEVRGEPVDVAGARALFDEDPFQFQFWACGLVGARPAGAKAGSKQGKKGADQGIDGVRPYVEGTRGPQTILVQVKGGKTSSRDIRDFRGTIEREGAAMGIFISLQEPTSAMKKEAASAGVYESIGKVRVPKVQIMTIKTLLAGGTPRQPNGVQLPPAALDPAADRTVKRARKHDEGALFQKERHEA